MRIVAALALACLAVAGVQAAEPQPGDLPPAVQALRASGITIVKSMPAPEGYRGYVGDFRGSPIPIYLLPDGKHVAIGSLYDASGSDLTAAPFRLASTPEYGEAEWTQLAQATWIPEGAKDPERIVYAFTDTECPYCHRLWEQSQPLLAGGKTQIRHVIVAVISPVRSGPRAAAILAAPDPAAALQEHERAFGHSPFSADGTVPGETAGKLDANALLMRRLGISGTPGLVYKDATGKVRVHAGVPRDAATLRMILLGD